MVVEEDPIRISVEGGDTQGELALRIEVSDRLYYLAQQVVDELQEYLRQP